MKNRTKVKYVVLQEYISESEQKMIKRAVTAVLPSVKAPQAFIEQSGPGPGCRSPAQAYQ